MKRYRRVWILAAVLVVFCGATFALTRYEQKQEQIRESQEIILQIPSDSVVALSWEYSGGGSLAFRKDQGVWQYPQDPNFPVSEEKIGDILAHFEEFGVTFAIDQVSDYAQYGLDAPECVLRIETQEEDYAIRMGAFSNMDQQRYIDIGDGRVYLVEEDPMTYVHGDLSAMIRHDDTPGFETVVDITFSGAENYTILCQEESSHTYAPQEDIFFAQQDGGLLPLDSARVRQYLNTVTSLALLDYATYHATQEELESYGLDAPLLSVTVNYTHTEKNEEGQKVEVPGSCTFHISEDPGQRAACDQAVEAGEAATPVTKYVRIGDSKIVYTLDDVDFGILRAAGISDLRHQELFWADFQQVTRMDVTLEGRTHTFTSRLVGQEEEQERIWFYGDAPQLPETTEDPEETTQPEGEEEGLDITNVKASILALTAQSFTQEQPGPVEEIALTLHLEDANFPSVQIRLYRYNGDSCLAVMDGQPVCLVSREQAMALVEAVQAIVLNQP